MKFINPFKKKESNEIYEISYKDFSEIEAGLADFIPRGRKRTNFEHHENLNFDDVFAKQQELKKTFSENGGDAYQGLYAKINYKE